MVSLLGESRKNFVEAVEAVTKTGYIYKDKDGIFKFSDKKTETCLKIADIAKQAKVIFMHGDDFEAMRKDCDLNVRLEKALDALNGRVTTSVSKKWWYCLYRIFFCFFRFSSPLDGAIGHVHSTIAGFEKHFEAERKRFAEQLEKEQVYFDPPKMDESALKERVWVRYKAYYEQHGLLFIEGIPDGQGIRDMVTLHQKTYALYKIVTSLTDQYSPSDLCKEFLKSFKEQIACTRLKGTDLLNLRAELKQWLKDINDSLLVEELHFDQSDIRSLPEEEINLLKDLKRITLISCKELSEINLSHPTLEILSVSYAPELVMFPNLHECQKLREVTFSFCGITQFNEDWPLQSSVTTLNLPGNKISYLPKWIQFITLKHLNVSATLLDRLPYRALTNFESLNITGTRIERVPEYIAGMPNLKSLTVNHKDCVPPIVTVLNPQLKVHEMPNVMLN